MGNVTSARSLGNDPDDNFSSKRLTGQDHLKVGTLSKVLKVSQNTISAFKLLFSSNEKGNRVNVFGSGIIPRCLKRLT